MPHTGHLSLEKLEPESLNLLSEQERAHLATCPQCRIEARLLREAFGVGVRTDTSAPHPHSGHDLACQIASQASDVLRVLSGISSGHGELSAVHPLARFHRTRWLGTGPNCVVFAVRDRDNGQRLAIKVLRSFDPTWLDHFRKAYERFSSVEHPNFAGIQQCWLSNQPAYCSVKLLQGDALIDALRRTSNWRQATAPAFDPIQVRHSFHQLAGVLSTLHRDGFVHGNLKPTNVFLEPNGRVVLTDAGCHSLTSTSDPYRAPENTGRAGRSSTDDWYALGALLCQALSGWLPTEIRRPELLDLLRLHAEDEVDLVDLCRQLTDPDPKKRPSPDDVTDCLSAQTLPTLDDPEMSGQTGLGRDTATMLGKGQAQAEPPKRFGAYLVERELGRGGMGVVYRCRHRDSGAPVAVKTVRVFRKQALSGIRSEIQALARANHPGVVRILDQGVQDGASWYAMPILEGVTLRRFGPTQDWQDSIGGTPDESALLKVLSVIHGVCSTLAHLHPKGLIHRDLKPNNILIKPGGDPVLVDFGLSANFGGTINREVLETNPTMAGTVPYMAPEQIRGELVDARADLYALGCIIYELVTGNPPFAGSSMLETLSRHLTETPRPPSEIVSEIPSELETIILRLLSKRSQERLGYAEDVANMLLEIGAQPVYSLPEGGRVYLYRSQLFGREAEFAAVDRCLTAAEDGIGSLLLIGGESGIGKTRFAMEVAKHATRRGFFVHTGECLKMGVSKMDPAAGVPLRPLRSSLQAMVDRCRDLGPSEESRLFRGRGNVLAQYHPPIGELPSQKTFGTPATLPADAARQRLLSYLAETYCALSEKGPLALILDDLGWADDLTIDFLRFLVQSGRLEQDPICIIGTYRTEETDAPLGQLESDRVITVKLTRLEDHAVSEMINEMLAWNQNAEVPIRLLAQYSEGNPFFVAEYLSVAIAEGWLRRDAGGGWTLGDAPDSESGAYPLPIPQSIEELVDRRISTLSDNGREILITAAVIGRQIDTPLLERAMPPDTDFVLGLDELVKQKTLEETDEGLSFAHDKIREGAYQTLSRSRQRELHRNVALAMETLGDEECHKRAAQLAHHWDKGGDAARAIEHYQLAAHQAKDSFSHKEARRLFRRLIDLWEPPNRLRIEAKCELAAEVLSFVGRGKEAIDLCRSGLEEANQLDDESIQAKCLHTLANLLNDIGEFDEAEKYGERALTCFRNIGDPKWEALTLSNLGRSHFARGLPQALDVCEQALAMQQQIGDWRSAGRTMNRIAGIWKDRGESARACELFKEALQVVRRVQDHQGEGMVICNLGITYLGMGHYEKAEKTFEKALAAHREIGHRVSEGITTMYQGVLSKEHGRLDEALRRFEEALTIHREINNRRWEGVACAHLAELHIEVGHPDKARLELDQALNIHRQLNDRTMAIDTLCHIAALERLTTGQLDVTERLLDEADALANQVENQLAVVQYLCERGYLLLAKGEKPVTVLEKIEKLMAESKDETGSTTHELIVAFLATVAAFEAARPLFRGQLRDQIPAGLRQWLKLNPSPE